MQYKWTVLWLEGLQETKLYRNTKLYCDRRARQLGSAQQAGTRGARGWARQVAGRAGVQARAGARQQERAGRARPGRWARGLARAVHSACFWPGLTQYCS